MMQGPCGACKEASGGSGGTIRVCFPRETSFYSDPDLENTSFEPRIEGVEPCFFW